MTGSSLSDAIADACRRFGERRAIRDGEICWTYSDLAARISDWSAAFAAAGMERIGFVLPNSAEYIAAMYGAVAAGRVPFLLDNALGPAEIAAIARDVGLDGLLATGSDGFALPAAGLALTAVEGGGDRPVLDPETAICRFTSGTSGTPKCLEFSHRAVVAAARVWSGANRMTPEDRVLCLAGFFNGLAFNTSLAATFLSGGMLIVHRGWASPSLVLRHAVLCGATRLVGFPAFYQILATSQIGPNDLPPTLRFYFSAASRLADGTRETLKERLGISVINYYGIAEAGPVTSEPDPETGGGNGLALDGCAIRIRDGALEVRTPYLATRYLNRPGAFEAQLTADGFFRTTDQARIEDGRLFLGERRDAVLDVGGKKFAPAEVVEALLKLPGIAEAHVFGEPSEDRGVTVYAAVGGAPGQESAALRRALAPLLAPFKIPQRIVVFERLPRNAAGKIDAVGIRAQFRKGELQDG